MRAASDRGYTVAIKSLATLTKVVNSLYSYYFALLATALLVTVLVNKQAKIIVCCKMDTVKS